METIEKDLPSAEQNKSSRRAAILMGGAALAGLALSRKAEAQTPTSDIDFLNFALNLEYLEAQYYTLATQGKTIDQVGVPIAQTGATGGTVTVKNATAATPNGNYASCLVPFTTPGLQELATEIAQDERNHVSFLQTALGTNYVPMPNIDLYNSFNALAAAVGFPGNNFDPFASETNFLLGAYIFEDVGVTAYHGAVSNFLNSAYTDKAAGIMAVEAYHAGAIRTRIYGSTTNVAPGVSLATASQYVSLGRANLDGSIVLNTDGTIKSGTTDDIGVSTITASGASTVVNSDLTLAAAPGTTGGNGLVFTRSPLQVLDIVYAVGLKQQPAATFPPPTTTPGPTTNSLSGGGFFPNAMNALPNGIK